MSDINKHPLESYNESEKVAYLCCLSSICYIDKDFSSEERKQLDMILDELAISGEGRGNIYASVFNLTNEQLDVNIKIINKLENSDVKFTLISDLCLLAQSDGNFNNEEYDYVLEFAEKLNISNDQVGAIKSVQENLYKIKDIPSNSEKAKEIVKDTATKLAATGVPIAAIAASGSVFGLSAAGMTSGLAGLGALVGGGMLAGAVVVVPAIAIGTAYGVKKLLDLVWSKQ